MTSNTSAANFARAAALVAGTSYLYVVIANIHAPWAIAWKGAGVGWSPGIGGKGLIRTKAK